MSLFRLIKSSTGTGMRRFGTPGAVAILVAMVLAVACGGGSGAGQTLAPSTPLPPVAYDAQSAAIGAQLVEEYGCNTCHSTDGTTLVGPTWQGLYGTLEETGGRDLGNGQ